MWPGQRVRVHSWNTCVVIGVAAAVAAPACSLGTAPLANTAPATRSAIDAASAREADERPGLGTSWGESITAPTSFEAFVRASPVPWAEVALRYNDLAGVLAQAGATDADPEPLELPVNGGALWVALLDGAGDALPGLRADGRNLVIGQDGARYRIAVSNTTAARFEVVASVDGLDVIDGRPASPDHRGYLIEPHGQLVLDGFRYSSSAVAAFRFGQVAASYAARTTGDRNVGVVGLAFFDERGEPAGAVRPERDPWTPGELRYRDTATPFPQRRFAPPP